MLDRYIGQNLRMALPKDPACIMIIMLLTTEGTITKGMATFKSRCNAITGRHDVENPIPVSPLINEAMKYAVRMKR